MVRNKGVCPMRLKHYMALATVIALGRLSGGTLRLAAQAAALPQAEGQPARGAGRGRGPAPREVWAAQPTTETPYAPPNRLIWRLSEIVAAHKGQASWRQAVVKTRDFEGEFIQMAPGEKTKTQFYSDDRAF